MWRGREDYLPQEAETSKATLGKSPERRETERLFSELNALSPAGFSAGLHIRFAAPLLYVRTYPDTWLKLYDDSAYALRDPLVFWGLAVKGYTRWSAIGLPDPFGIMEQARSFGLNFGAVVSEGPLTSRSIVGVARADREFSDDELEEIAAVVTALHAAAEPRAELTDAQVEALRLLSEGDRHTAAAAKLGISESAFKARLQSARVRLGARTTAQALRKARELQLL